MPSFLSTSKAVGSVISRRNMISHFVRHAKSGGRLGNFDQIRCVSSISGIENTSVHPLLGSRKEDSNVSLNNFFNHYTCQRRRFLGCGDGEEGGVLSKVYEERIVMG